MRINKVLRENNKCIPLSGQLIFRLLQQSSSEFYKVKLVEIVMVEIVGIYDKIKMV